MPYKNAKYAQFLGIFIKRLFIIDKYLSINKNFLAIKKIKVKWKS